MTLHNVIIVCIALILLAFSTAACEKEGTAEKAGKEVDRALDSAKKKIDEATK